MENIVRESQGFYEAVKWEQEAAGEEERVLVLIFSFCVSPPSKRINHKRVIS